MNKPVGSISLLRFFTIAQYILTSTLGLMACHSDDDRDLNVLFIVVDDMNDWVGALGHEQVQTPNIDKLARQGVLFTNAHCAAPVCNPSRVAVMTGKMPATTGVYENFTSMREQDPDVITLSQYFGTHGYGTFGGGKIFHDPPPHNYDSLSFQEYYWWNEDGPRGSMVGNRWRSPYSVPPDPQPDERPTKRITPLTKRNFDWGPVNLPESTWPDHMVTEWAAGVLNRKHDSPFFLAVGIFRPHVPWFNPTKYFDIYPSDQVPLPPVLEDDLSDLGEWAQKRAADNASKHDSLKAFGEWTGAVQAYLASISFSDAMVGRVLDALDTSAYKDHTIVVLWSDHGYHLGEKNHWHKRTLWERSTHVPLIIYVPGNPENGKKAQQPTSLADLYPTLIDLCGLPQNPQLDGRSLRPILLNTGTDWPYPAVTTYLEGNHAVRTDGWRYIRYADGGQELYDHTNDPNEWRNLAADPKYRQTIENLSRWIPDDQENQSQ
jgi:arylsulfatase A-like enzyme